MPTREEFFAGPQPSRRPLALKVTLFSVVGVVALLGLIMHLSRRLTYTGDEPRYLHYALSFYSEGTPTISEEGFENFKKRQASEIRIATTTLREIQRPSRIPSHPILSSLILSPFASLPLQQIRLVSLVAGLVGLSFLARLLIAQGLPLFAALACFVPAALFLPGLPYFFLALPEVFLFFLTSVAFWNILSAPDDKLRNFWPAIICSCLSPFIHLRGAPLFVTVALYLVGKFGWRQEAGISWRSLARIGCIYSAAIFLVVLCNRAIYGDIFGSVNTARPSLDAVSLGRLLFDWRHGLLTYAPVYLLSFAGLIAGLWQRRRWGLPAAIFLVLSIAATAGPAPGESYSARFWVQSVPVLAICLLGFVQGQMPLFAKAAVYVLLGGLSFAHSVLFLTNPDLYLAARSGSAAYDRLFEIAPSIHFGYWMDQLAVPNYHYAALGFIAAAILSIALASIIRSRLLVGLAVAVILAGFEIHRAHAVKQTTKLEPNSMTAMIEEPSIGRAPLRLEMRAPWRGDCPVHLISVSDGADHWEEMVKSTAILRRPGKWPVPLTVHITWNSSTADITDAAEVRTAVSDSWLAKLFW